MNDLIRTNKDGVAVVSSREIAGNFNKEHCKVLRSIENIVSTQPSQKWIGYFIPSEYEDMKGEKRKEFL